MQVLSKQRLEKNSTHRVMLSPSAQKYQAFMEMVNSEKKKRKKNNTTLASRISIPKKMQIKMIPEKITRGIHPNSTYMA